MDNINIQTEQQTNPSYYAILTAEVRYDKQLKAAEKLLYAEITALANKEGYCFATNSYLAELYSTHKNSISRYISSLEKRGYIRVVIIHDENTKQILQRRIYINTHTTNGIAENNEPNTPNNKTVYTSKNKTENTPKNKTVYTPNNRTVKDNNINNIILQEHNITSNNNRERETRARTHATPPTKRNCNFSSKNKKLKFGKYQNVLLTQKEKDALVDIVGEYKLQEYIDRLDKYCEKSGKKYGNYDLVIRDWINQDEPVWTIERMESSPRLKEAYKVLTEVLEERRAKAQTSY